MTDLPMDYVNAVARLATMPDWEQVIARHRKRVETLTAEIAHGVKADPETGTSWQEEYWRKVGALEEAKAAVRRLSNTSGSTK